MERLDPDSVPVVLAVVVLIVGLIGAGVSLLCWASL